jgi:hypothetical protein
MFFSIGYVLTQLIMQLMTDILCCTGQQDVLCIIVSFAADFEYILYDRLFSIPPQYTHKNT